MNSNYIIIGYILLIFIFGFARRVNCYQSFIKGIGEGTKNVVNMFSYLLCFTLAITMFISCGVMEDIISLFGGEIYPLLALQGVTRAFSASSSLAMMTEIYTSYGVDSFQGIAATFIHVATDTTFYMVGFYFGTIGITKIKNSLFLGIIINIFGFILSMFMAIVIIGFFGI